MIARPIYESGADIQNLFDTLKAIQCAQALKIIGDSPWAN